MVSEKDLQSYLKVAASALPCREARKEFSSYVHNVAHDISIENPDADFATVASLLGTTPKQVAADFVESQSPQTISRWNRSAHRYNFFRYFVSNDLNINYLLCNLNRYVVDISIMG